MDCKELQELFPLSQGPEENPYRAETPIERQARAAELWLELTDKKDEKKANIGSLPPLSRKSLHTSLRNTLNRRLQVQPVKSSAPIRKKAGMPFLEQNRPSKVKEIYSALKRDHPNMPAEMKARIAARQGKPGKQRQGPPYEAPITRRVKKRKPRQYRNRTTIYPGPKPRSKDEMVIMGKRADSAAATAQNMLTHGAAGFGASTSLNQLSGHIANSIAPRGTKEKAKSIATKASVPVGTAAGVLSYARLSNHAPHQIANTAIKVLKMDPDQGYILANTVYPLAKTIGSASVGTLGTGALVGAGARLSSRWTNPLHDANKRRKEREKKASLGDIKRIRRAGIKRRGILKRWADKGITDEEKAQTDLWRMDAKKRGIAVMGEYSDDQIRALDPKLKNAPQSTIERVKRQLHEAGPHYMPPLNAIYLPKDLARPEILGHEIGHAQGTKVWQKLRTPGKLLSAAGVLGGGLLSYSAQNENANKILKASRNIVLATGAVGAAPELIEEARATTYSLKGARKRGGRKRDYLKTLGPAYGTYLRANLAWPLVGAGSIEVLRHLHNKSASVSRENISRSARNTIGRYNRLSDSQRRALHATVLAVPVGAIRGGMSLRGSSKYPDGRTRDEAKHEDALRHIGEPTSVFGKVRAKYHKAMLSSAKKDKNNRGKAALRDAALGAAAGGMLGGLS